MPNVASMNVTIRVCGRLGGLRVPHPRYLSCSMFNSQGSVRPLAFPLRQYFVHKNIRQNSTFKTKTEGTNSTLIHDGGSFETVNSRYEVWRRVSFSIVGIFVIIYGGHWYVSSKESNQRNSQIAVNIDPKRTDNDFTRWLKTQINKPEKPSVSVEQLFSTRMLAHRVMFWPPNFKNWQDCYPFAASMWSHFNLWHLLLNSQALMVIMPQTMFLLGTGRTVAAFVASGLLGTGIQCTADKAYAQGQYADYFQYVKSSRYDTQPQRTLQTFHLGASGAICGLLAITELAKPSSKPTTFTTVFLAFTAYGYYMGEQAYPAPLDRIGHSGHLGGLLSGALLWFGWLRWTRLGAGGHKLYK